MDGGGGECLENGLEKGLQLSSSSGGEVIVVREEGLAVCFDTEEAFFTEK